ncbi:hypothetical protein GCM10010472_47560 [Pseudonocardia halophobica]|uniref:Uncharacterized protein n=1 Tax=Pseudonocardia halophobica TaxID=29401 RepID=A0A9W6NYA9_9PSEU|nr:hypothetical protein GCM10017577_47150 [Pseudonocardia halophobica]
MLSVPRPSIPPPRLAASRTTTGTVLTGAVTALLALTAVVVLVLAGGGSGRWDGVAGTPLVGGSAAPVLLQASHGSSNHSPQICQPPEQSALAPQQLDNTTSAPQAQITSPPTASPLRVESLISSIDAEAGSIYKLCVIRR